MKITVLSKTEVSKGQCLLWMGLIIEEGLN